MLNFFLRTPRVNMLPNVIVVLYALQRIRGIGWMFVETSHEMYLLKQVNEQDATERTLRRRGCETN